MEFLAIGLASILGLAILSQWLAWRLRIPSILVLISVGLLVGPVTGLLNPDALLGREQLPVLVSFFVAIILFEGGLSLSIRSIDEVRGVIWNLLLFGALVTWMLSTVAAQHLAGLSFPLALLTGAILVVTGPTVIIPLLRHIRLIRPVNLILQWEAIVIDFVGATFAVLVFESLVRNFDGQTAFSHLLLGVIRTLVVGGVFGSLAAWLLILFLKKDWIPEHLQNPVTLMLVIGSFSLSNQFQSESGLLTVTLMGILLANQTSVKLRHILEFKENLGILLLGLLFILLSARVQPSAIQQVHGGYFLFLLALIFFIRPFSVFVSSIGSALTWKERLFLSLMAPRGIVAASVASLFSLKLSNRGYAGAEQIISLMFFVILGTVIFYSVIAPIAARLLGLVETNPQGLLFVGAHPWARQMARSLQQEKIAVLLIDSNQRNVEKAKAMELPALCTNVLSDEALENLELDGIGRILALTSNNEVNTLSVIRFADVFGRSEIYQLPIDGLLEEKRASRPSELPSLAPESLLGRFLFHPRLHYEEIQKRFDQGSRILKFKTSSATPFASLAQEFGEEAIPLFVIHPQHRVEIVTGEVRPPPERLVLFLSAPSAELSPVTSADDLPAYPSAPSAPV